MLYDSAYNSDFDSIASENQQVSLSFSPQLKVLDLSWCEDLTDRGMSIIANSCPSLQHLSLRQCSASTFTLDALAANGRHMSYLNIAGIDGLTDVALGSMAENMPLLNEIDVSWNSSLSDVGVIALLQCCTKLKKAVLCGLKRITSQPFLAIIGDLGQWFLLEELCRSNRRPLRNVSEGKLVLKFCDTVSSYCSYRCPCSVVFKPGMNLKRSHCQQIHPSLAPPQFSSYGNLANFAQDLGPLL